MISSAFARIDSLPEWGLHLLPKVNSDPESFPEMLYVSGSSGAQFDERAEKLRGCEDGVAATANSEAL